MGVVALGAVLRFWGLGRQSMWNDELFSAFVSSKSILGIIRETAADTGPPGFYFAESAVVRFFGVTEVTMRLLPALAGVLTIWVIYSLGRRLFDARTGFGAATLFAISYMPIRYAQEARAYSFLMLFAALGMLTLLRLAEKPGLLRAIAFGAALTGLAYMHTYGVFGGAALVLAMLAIPDLRRRTRWWGIGAAAVAALLFVPWGLVTIDQVHAVGGYVDAGTWHVHPPNLIQDFWSIIDSYTPWPYPKTWASVAFASVLVAGLGVAWSKPEWWSARAKPKPGLLRLCDRDAIALLAIAVLVPIVLGLGLSKLVVPIQELRCFLVGLPGAYLIATYGAFHLFPDRRLRGFSLSLIPSVVLLLLVLAGATIGMPWYYTQNTKGHYREAVQYLLSKNAQAEGPLIVSSNFLPLSLNQYAVIEHYPRQFQIEKVNWWYHDDKLDKALWHLLEGRNSVYIITAFVPIEADGTNAFDASMRRAAGWRLLETRNFESYPRVEHWVRE